MFSLYLTGIRFAATTQNDNDRIEMSNNRYFKFQFQCQDTVMVYPDLLEERDVFSNPRRLRDYSIVLHAIPSEMLVDDVKIVFGLIDEKKKDEYYIAWQVSLSFLLFGPKEVFLTQTSAKEVGIQYNLIFQNKSYHAEDYWIQVNSIRVTNLPSSQYSYLFTSQTIDCISSHLTSDQNHSMTIRLPEIHKLKLSNLKDQVFSFKLFGQDSIKFDFSLNGEECLSYLLYPYCTYPMKYIDSSDEMNNPEVELVVEINPTRILSSCEESMQYQKDLSSHSLCIPIKDSYIPIQIEDSSIILPHSPLFLSISKEGYSIQKQSIFLLSIPFSTIESCQILSKQSLLHDIATGTIELLFNRQNKGFSDWIRFQVTYEENHPIWNLLSLSPSLKHHKSYFFVEKVEPVWYKLQNQKDMCIFYNTATGRYSSGIPKEKIKSYSFERIEELRPIDLISIYWNENESSIIVKDVHSEVLRKSISSGYYIVSVLFHSDKQWIDINKDVIEMVCKRLLQTSSYPLQICFANPY